MARSGSEVRRRGREQGESERGRADRDDTGAFIHAARGSRRWPGEAGGGRGSVGARHASPLFVLLAEEEEDKGEGGGLGRLGKLGRLWWAAGELGKLLLSVLFFVFYFVLFNLFCHCFEF